MEEKDIPKRVVVVLLILTIVVSFLGTLTFIEVYNSMPKENPGLAQGVVTLTIRDPNTPAAAQPQQKLDSTGKVSVSIKG